MGKGGWRDRSGRVGESVGEEEGGGAEGMNTFFTPPSHSTAQLIEASVCLFQLFCFLSSLIPRSRRTHSGAASTRFMCIYACACKMGYICRLGLVAAGRPHSLGGFCDVDGRAVVAFNDCANEMQPHTLQCLHPAPLRPVAPQNVTFWKGYVSCFSDF